MFGRLMAIQAPRRAAIAAMGLNRSVKRLQATPHLAALVRHNFKALALNRRAVIQHARGNALVKRGLRVHAIASIKQAQAQYRQGLALKAGLQVARKLF